MKLPKIPDDAIAECIMGHSAEYTVPAGTTFRGSAPEVRARPECFLQQPFTEAERIQAIRDRWPEADAGSRIFK